MSSRTPAACAVAAAALSIALAPAAGASPGSAQGPASTQPAAAGVVGTLADIARDRLDGRVPLSTLKGSAPLWAIGMPNGLDRELLVEGGRIASGGFEDHRYVLHHPRDTDGAFLVHARVEYWREVPLPADIRSFADLEAFVGRVGADAGLDAQVPFPFRLRARALHLRWFVVGGMGDRLPDPRASFERARTLGGLQDVGLEALGFYSRYHRGIATNPRSNMHVHFRTTTGMPFVAHLDDDVLLAPGGVLMLPE
jgi:acetolactate decarboxylase